MGGIVGVNGYRVNLTVLKQRFAEGGYQMQEAPHFLLFTRDASPTTVLVHRLAPSEIDVSIGDRFREELKPLGILTTEQQFGEIFGAVVCSLAPTDPQAALHLYASNSLRAYRSIIAASPEKEVALTGTLSAFGMLYRRVCQLHRGMSFLDVGCSLWVSAFIAG